MLYLQALMLCWGLMPRLEGATFDRCIPAAMASHKAGAAHRVDPATLLVIGWRESGWQYKVNPSGACGAWQVIGTPCSKMRTLDGAADAGAAALRAWQDAAARNRRPARAALAAYACGYAGLNGRGCAWYARTIERLAAR